METKITWSLIGNTLGFGISILGAFTLEAGGWKQGILFSLAAIFFTVKIGSGILDLIKKKYSSMNIYWNHEQDEKN